MTFTDDPVRAVAGADCVVTDTWVSMGDKEGSAAQSLKPYQVNERLMAGAKDAIFMHCLPAHRGEEVTDEVIDGPQSGCSTKRKTAARAEPPRLVPARRRALTEFPRGSHFGRRALHIAK